MTKSPKGVWLLFICLFLASCSQPTQTQAAPQAVDGVLDLRNWDFEKHGQVSLSGDWEFYWGELLAPSEIEPVANPLFVTVPDSWTNYEVNGQSLPVEGYATYRLNVMFPKESTVYGLYIDGEGTAYTLWVDGNLIAKDGHVATNRQEMIPQSNPKVVLFETDGVSTEIVIQISNFHHRKAGFRNELLSGSPSQVHEYQSSLTARDTFIMGIYLVIVLYHLAIFLFRPANKSPLYFALWSAMLFVRASLLNQKTFFLLLPATSWAAALRIEYFTFYFISAIYALFIHSLYPDDIDRWMLKITIGLSTGFTAFMAFTDTLTTSYTVTPYQIILLLEMLYFVFFIGRIISRKREGALYIAVASLIGFTGMTIEILSLQNIIPVKVDGLIGFMAFVFIQAILLSDRLSKSFYRAEVLSDQLKEANLNLRENETKYRTIFEESKDVIFIAGLDERIKEANPASADILGYSQDELRRMRMSDLLLYEQDREKVETILREQETAKDVELELRRKDGRVIHALVTLTMRRNVSGEITEIQGNIHDISSRMQAESQRIRAMELEKLAITDPLTHVYNRRIFDEIAVKEWTRTLRNNSTFSIVLLDVDHFKKINDTHGHAVGDQVLIQLSRLCLTNTRSMDIFARYGGEEFVILMPDTDKDSAYQSMERLRAVIQETPTIVMNEDKSIFITVSMGIADLKGQDPPDVQSLLDRADQALYISKKSGRNRVTVWEEAASSV